MPRFTYAPSGMSFATRFAISSRVNRFMSGLLSCRCGLMDRLRPRDHALHENAGRHDHFGIEGAERHDFRPLRNRGLRAARHDRTEVTRPLPLDQVSPAVAL